jgi:hypothetical protein
MTDLERLLADSEQNFASESQTKNIGALIAKAENLNAEIDSLTRVLVDRWTQFRTITEKELPELMDSAQLKATTSQSGKKVEIVDDVKGNISEQNKLAALSWLRSHNDEGIIKNVIEIPLSKGKDNMAGEILAYLQEQWGIEAERKESVHYQTLCAWLRRKLEDGADLPVEPVNLFGLHVQRLAKISGLKKVRKLASE